MRASSASIAARWLSAPRAATIAVVLGSLVLAASSWVEAPMWPVPMTLQTYAVLVIGALLGARLAATTVALYLIEGAAGLPFFAGGGGFAHLIGPTGGYLAGFLIAGALIGAMVERGWAKSFVGLLGAMTIGHVLVFALGVLQLQAFVGWSGAWTSGVAPFILGSIVKTLAAAATVRAAAPFLNAPRA